jgi:hypothetical protein
VRKGGMAGEGVALTIAEEAHEVEGAEARRAPQGEVADDEGAHKGPAEEELRCVHGKPRRGLPRGEALRDIWLKRAEAHLHNVLQICRPRLEAAALPVGVFKHLEAALEPAEREEQSQPASLPHTHTHTHTHNHNHHTLT